MMYVPSPPSVPHRCPVCSGRGHVASGFYGTDNAGSSLTVCHETCRSCGGSGVLWGPHTAPPTITVTPPWVTYGGDTNPLEDDG